jgi:hypothetical protein
MTFSCSVLKVRQTSSPNVSHPAGLQQLRWLQRLVGTARKPQRQRILRQGEPLALGQLLVAHALDRVAHPRELVRDLQRAASTTLRTTLPRCDTWMRPKSPIGVNSPLVHTGRNSPARNW